MSFSGSDLPTAKLQTFRFDMNASSVDNSSQGVETSLSGEYLVVLALPDCLEDRYGRLPEKIYVRDCYRRLYEIVADLMLSGALERGATLFTGVPGIGKSLFLVYFIYRFLHDDRFLDKEFALELEPGSYTHFLPTAESGVFTCTERSTNQLTLKHLLLLCDVAANVPPARRARWTFLFSSPAPNRYKEFLKILPCKMYTMPTWSEQELMFVNSDVESWYDDFVLFGGVPRHVFSTAAGIDPRTKLDNALTMKGGAVVEAFYKYGFGTVDSEQSYMLVHINPPTLPDGGFVYDGNGRAVYTFASDAIFQLLAAKYHAKMLAEAVNVFNAGVAPETYGAVSAGNYFEKICLWLKPLDGCHINATALRGGGYIDFTVPRERYLLPRDWKKTANLPVDELILPRISNLESGDAFFVLENGVDSYLLVVLQITVGSSHPVRANGLRDILLAFPESVRHKITRKAFVFVTPNWGTLDKEQKLITQRGEEIAAIPRDAQGFQQYVYRHKL